MKSKRAIFASGLDQKVVAGILVRIGWYVKVKTLTKPKGLPLQEMIYRLTTNDDQDSVDLPELVLPLWASQ